jgi:hypothetical protein
MVVWEVGYMERVHGWIYRRFGERAERMVWLCVGIGIGPRARQSEFFNWESEPVPGDRLGIFESVRVFAC